MESLICFPSVTGGKGEIQGTEGFLPKPPHSLWDFLGLLGSNEARLLRKCFSFEGSPVADEICQCKKRPNL